MHRGRGGRRAGQGGLALLALAASCLAPSLPAATASTSSTPGVVEVDGGQDGRYVVVLRPSSAIRSSTGDARAASVAGLADAVAAEHRAAVTAVYGYALDGFAATMAPDDAEALARDAAVAAVYEDGVVHADEIEPNAPWGLDRTDQRDLPLDTAFSYGATGDGVRLYVIDSGVRGSASDFGGRVRAGYSAFGAGSPADQDCNGHGTHVAGIAAGEHYGVAKDAEIVAVRVLGCSGSAVTSQIIAGIDWVTADADENGDGDARDTGEGPIANVSIGGPPHAALQAAVTNSIATGISYAVSAGNDNADACSQSPANVSSAITVAATTAADSRASFSNWGTCVDLFAPGSEIVSVGHLSDVDSEVMSGTSQAAPHVAGALAAWRQVQPVDFSFPGFPTIRTRLLVAASANRVTNAGTGSPNLLLFQDPPRIELVLWTTPETAEDFEFSACTAAGTGCQHATLDDDFTSDRHDRTSFAVTGAGSWQLSETSAPSGWGLTSITCTNGEGSPDPVHHRTTLDLTATERTRCTFAYAPAVPSLSGTITEAGSGAPVEGAWVIGVGLDGGGVRGTATQADGTYEMETGAGPHLVEVADPLVHHRGEWYDDRPLSDLAGATIVTVDGPVTVDAALDRLTGDLEGTVTAPGGSAPLGGVWVAAVPVGGGPLAGTVTEGDGTYRLADLAPGSYLVAFVDPSGAHEFGFHDGVTSPALAEPVAVTAGAAATVDAELASAGPGGGAIGAVAGSVQGGGGEPVAGAWVVAIAADGSVAGGATSGVDGTYHLALPPGTYRIEFVDPAGVHEGEYHADQPLDRFADATPVTIAGPSTVVVDAELASRAGTISGIVTDEVSGEAVPGAWVAVVAPNGSLEIGTQASADGAYAVAGLSAGDHLVVALDPSGAHRPRWYGGDADFASAVPVGLAGPGDAAAANLALTPAL